MIRIDVSRRLGDFNIEARFDADIKGIVALFGRSGAGKTSIINMIAGLLKPDRGKIELNGDVLFDAERGINIAPHKRRVGYVFQESRLFPHLSVRRNLEYGRRRAPAGEQGHGLDEVTEVLGIAGLLDRKPGSLSGGERQRIALGRALLSHPRLLLMDEPLVSLDLARKLEILPFIEEIRDRFGVPIIYVSHVMDEIIRLANTLVLIDDGRVAAVGSVEELTSRLDLRPLTGRYEAGAAIAATIKSHDRKYALTILEFTGGELRVPILNAAVGTAVRLRVRARDISLSLDRPRNVSDANILKGIITEIARPEDGAEPARSTHVDIRLDVGVPLWVRITRWSLDKLGFETGDEVYALIKGTSIDRFTLGGQKSTPEQEKN